MPNTQSKHQTTWPVSVCSLQIYPYTCRILYSQGRRKTFLPRTKMGDFGIDDIDNRTHRERESVIFFCCLFFKSLYLFVFWRFRSHPRCSVVQPIWCIDCSTERKRETLTEDIINVSPVVTNYRLIITIKMSKKLASFIWYDCDTHHRAFLW